MKFNLKCAALEDSLFSSYLSGNNSTASKRLCSRGDDKINTRTLSASGRPPADIPKKSFKRPNVSETDS